MSKYWCGWETPFSIPDEHMVEKWPDGMLAWTSGEGNDYLTWVGLLTVKSADAAIKMIEKCYGESANKITMRWEPELKPDDYKPGDRFR